MSTPMRNMKCRTAGILLAAICLCVQSSPAQSMMDVSHVNYSYQTAEANDSSDEHATFGVPLHVSGVLGVTSIYDHGTYPTAGLDILTKPFSNTHIDVGMAGEVIWADHTEYIAGLFLGYTISHHVPVTFSYTPSFLLIEGESDFMHVAGVAYAFHLGKLTISPMTKFEFIHGHTNVMGGIGIGTHF